MPFSRHVSSHLPLKFAQAFGQFIFTKSIQLSLKGVVTRDNLIEPFYQAFGAFVWSVLNGETSVQKDDKGALSYPKA